MKKLISLLSIVLAALVLNACGPQTLINVSVDAMTLLPKDDLKGDAPIAGGFDLKFPDDPNGKGFDSADFGVSEDIYANLQEFTLDLSTRFTLSEGAQPLDGTIGIYINSNTSPVFDAGNPIEFKFSLAPGEARDTPLNISITKENPLLT